MVRANRIALFVGAILVAASWLPAAEPQDEKGRWFKGNLHTHSLWSDGNDFPEMICDWYRQHGYDFLALSDHNILSKGEKWIDADLPSRRGAIGAVERYRARFGDDWVQTRQVDGGTEVRLRPLNEFRTLLEQADQFLLIQAEEITDHFQSAPVHINASNLEELIRPQGGSSVRDVIANNLRAVTNQSRRLNRPILAHLNHPNFGYAITAEDLAVVVEERFFEVYNGHPSVHHLGDAEHVSVERMWDIANTIRIADLQAAPLFGLATDDSHHYFSERGATPGRGWIMVRAARLAPEAIIDAITRGSFYASSGVTLQDVRWDSQSGWLEVDIEADAGAEYTTHFIGTLDNFSEDKSADDAIGRILKTATGERPRYRLRGHELYVRALVTSNRPAVNPSFQGQRQQAWTQPVGWERHIEDADAQGPSAR